MITGDKLRQCTTLESVVEILKALGYPAQSTPVDHGEFARLTGLNIPAGMVINHFARVGNVDLIGLQSDVVPSSFCSELLLYLNGVNALHKQVLFALSTSLHQLSMLDVSAQGRIRRLAVSTDCPRTQDLDRLNAIELFDYQAREAIEPLFDRALDRESVTRRFFRNFRDAVRAVDEGLHALCPNETKESTSEQALLILSRILFLYFVQEKGWLDRNRHFLVDRVSAAEGSGAASYGAVLRPLFFGCLNTPASSRTRRARQLGAIPYLNGGLFEPSPFEVRNRDVNLPNALIRRVLESAFEPFSFSIEENDEDAVIVDPEMLGKVFESLMESEERLNTGSFYTPRAIVDILAGEAIVRWCSRDDERTASVLWKMIRMEEVAVDASCVRKLLNRLDQLRILDPAVGSGAFLLSSLKIVERLIRALSSAAGTEVPTGLRQKIVERCLFGVDMKPQAVRLCELRLWLAIVSSSTASAEDVPPLPNLDRNVQQGNSLLSPLDFLGGGRREIYQQWAVALRNRRELADRYRHSLRSEKQAICRKLRRSDLALASSLLTQAVAGDEDELRLLRGQRKLKFEGRPATASSSSPSVRLLESRIAETRRVLANVHSGQLDFFSYETHFADVIADGGFDVVLGNPPWVRGSRMDAGMRQMYSERYPSFSNRSGGGIPQCEVAVAFVDKALSLTRQQGVISMLVPAKILTARYAAALRNSLIIDHTVVALRDWSDEAKRLFAADTFPLGLTVQKGRAGRGDVRVTRGSGCGSSTLEAGQISVGDSSSEWSLETTQCRRILDRIRSQHRALRDVLGRTPVMGVKTGDNARFFIEELEVRPDAVYLPRFDLCIPPEAVCRSVRGRDIQRWRSADSLWMLWPPLNGWSSSLVWAVKLARCLGIDLSALRLSYVCPEHLGIKVVWKDVSRGFKAAVLPENVEIAGRSFSLVPNQTAYALDASSVEEAYVIAAVLNSSVVDALMVSVADRAKDFHYRYFGTTVAALPFVMPDPSSEASRVLVRLARRALQGQDVQHEIDCAVAALYGLSEEEESILQAHVQFRLGFK